MRIDFYNVTHGQCAVITCPNGRRIMIDCGDRSENGRFWTPGVHYAGQFIDMLAVTNLDEDHLSDYALMSKYVGIGRILTNPSIGASELISMKGRDGMGPGTQAFFGWLRNPAKSAAPPLDLGGVDVRYYCNLFNPLTLRDTNNLSLVLVIQYGDFKIVFPGDLEASGWRHLLANQTMLAWDLVGTNIFIASHHGRVSGCCEEVFDIKGFEPEIVIFSDAAKQFGTQETDDWYRPRCRGGILVADQTQRRFVITTRKDGDFRIDAMATGYWRLDFVEVQDWPVSPLVQPNTLGALELLR